MKQKQITDAPRVTMKESSKKQESAVSYCEKYYPVTCSEFRRIQEEQYQLFCKKHKNYGPDNISVGTNLSTPEDIDLSLTGIWFRCVDKFNRWKQMVIHGHSDEVGESVQDTFQDLSIYAVIAQIVKNGKWAK